MTNSQALLIEYAEHGNESAFKELVDRYIDLVYSTALRQVGGDRPLAQDVAQIVFLHLAKKARRIPSGVMLGGWLHQATINVTATVARAERRRKMRERQAVEMNTLQNDSTGSLDHVGPILDEAISQLADEDRSAVLLRFFEKRSFRSVGEELGSSEDAARMRVNRALEKLESLLKQRGIAISATALGAALAEEAVAAAPVGLAANVAASVLAGAVAAGGANSSVFKIMTITKLKLGSIGAVLIGGLVTSLFVQHQSLALLREDNRSLQQQVEQLRGTEEQLAKAKVDQDELERLRRGQSELLRLRGEVIALRNAPKATVLQPLPADRVNPGANAVPDTVSPVTRLQATIRTRVGSGDTLVTGGWISGSGKRIFVLATPSVLGENADQVNINTKVVEVPEAVLPEVGLDTFRTEGAESSLQQVIAAAQMDILLKKLQATDGTDLIAQGGVSVSDGRQGQVRASNEQTIDGVKIDLGPVIAIFPVISGDKKAIDLTLQVGINRLAPKAR
jgi:RNA polymerase sigma factor (sigma-70 family)